MANELILQVRIEDPLPFTCADGTGIEKGALLKMSDPRTAAIASAALDKGAGVAAREKVVSDGRTEIGVFRRGWFLAYASGAINAGDPLQVGVVNTYPNFVQAAGVTASGASLIGTALETAANGEQFLMELNIAGSAAIS